MDAGEVTAGYKDLGVRIKSANLLPILMLLSLVGLALAGGVLLRDGQAALSRQLEVAQQQHSGMLEELRILSYILSLPEAQRPALLPPSGLARRLQDRPWWPEDQP